MFGFGNPARGDDALGLALLDRCARDAKIQGLLARCRLVEAIQLQIEHALDLYDQELALFVDASIDGRAPYSFRRLRAQRDVTYTSHAMSPAAVLQVYETIALRSAPPAYQLTVAGESFQLDAPLSDRAERHLDAAYRLLVHLCSAPQAALWEKHAHEDAV